MTEQPRTVARQRLVAAIGTVTADCLEECRTWLHDYLCDAWEE
jgi:hypothetical protein